MAAGRQGRADNDEQQHDGRRRVWADGRHARERQAYRQHGGGAGVHGTRWSCWYYSDPGDVHGAAAGLQLLLPCYTRSAPSLEPQDGVHVAGAGLWLLLLPCWTRSTPSFAQPGELDLDGSCFCAARRGLSLFSRPQVACAEPELRELDYSC